MVVRIVSQVVDGGIIVRGGITVMVQGFKDYYLCTSRLNNIVKYHLQQRQGMIKQRVLLLRSCRDRAGVMMWYLERENQDASLEEGGFARLKYHCHIFLYY